MAGPNMVGLELQMLRKPVYPFQRDWDEEKQRSELPTSCFRAPSSIGSLLLMQHTLYL